jgi:Family of unknown function (DUF5996)
MADHVELPALPIQDWRPTKDTLHLFAQIVGKIRMAATAPRSHWWNVPLYVGVRGLTTHRMRDGGVGFSIDFDFVDHQLVVRTDGGRVEGFALHDGLSVADFYESLFTLLAELGIGVKIRPEPFGVPMTTPFPQDKEHASYDPAAIERFWRMLSWTNDVFEEFAGWFVGKSSPVHLYWHSFDLAVTRFSGRRAPVRPEADRVTAEAYTHEVISFGFWPGDDKITEPSYYSYTAPEPVELADHPLHPPRAVWAPQGATHMALLAYDHVRAADDPRETLLGFLQSAYTAGATAADWPIAELTSTWSPV